MQNMLIFVNCEAMSVATLTRRKSSRFLGKRDKAPMNEITAGAD